jgi:hypothetical protein
VVIFMQEMTLEFNQLLVNISHLPNCCIYYSV